MRIVIILELAEFSRQIGSARIHLVGFVSAWSCALAATAARSLDAVKMARALGGMKLPSEDDRLLVGRGELRRRSRSSVHWSL
jgi:hypothetical protein